MFGQLAVVEIDDSHTLKLPIGSDPLVAFGLDPVVDVKNKCLVGHHLGGDPIPLTQGGMEPAGHPQHSFWRHLSFVPGRSNKGNETAIHSAVHELEIHGVQPGPESLEHLAVGGSGVLGDDPSIEGCRAW